ncbi:hypothetical protein BDV11DRAFT_20663 [Aspergillus similis]
MVVSLLHSLLPCPALARRALRLHVAAANYGVDGKVRHDSNTRSIACLFFFSFSFILCYLTFFMSHTGGPCLVRISVRAGGERGSGYSERMEVSKEVEIGDDAS